MFDLVIRIKMMVMIRIMVIRMIRVIIGMMMMRVMRMVRKGCSLSYEQKRVKISKVM